jgi:hypothetical protein
MKMWVKYGAKPHGFMFFDDLGEQGGPFFSPKIFQKFYEEVYQPIFDTAHELGCEFHMHSCGKIDKLIPHLLEWGLDAIEVDSPRMIGYHDLKALRGKIMFWACVNSQTLYPNGTPEDCEREVWHMIRNLGTPEGGYGAYFYPDPDSLHTPKENIKAFKRGVRKYGNYAKIPPHWWTSPPPQEWEDDKAPPLPPQQPPIEGSKP